MDIIIAVLLPQPVTRVQSVPCAKDESRYLPHGKEGSTGETAQDRRPGVPAAIESVCLSVCRMARAVPKDLPGLPGVLVWGCGSSSRDYKRPNPHSLDGKGLWAAWCRRDLVRHYLLDAKRVASR